MIEGVWPVILSGGVGSRLWPLSRSASPKQLLPLAGAETMLQATAARTPATDGFHPPLIVAGTAHAAAIEAQLAAAGHQGSVIIVEPEGRNTAPAIALAAHHVATCEREGALLVMPSDHVIADVPGFLAAVADALPFARAGWLVTFGCTPDAPETGYGYIQQGEPLGTRVRRVARFVEKPARATAEAYLAEGNYSWNAGIFLLRADRYLDELRLHAPGIAHASAAAMSAATTNAGRIHPATAAFLASPSDSIDYAVMEKAERVAVSPIEVGWSDIGSWDALKDIGQADANGNVVRGDVLAVGSEGCLLRSEGPLVAAVGLSGITVVATDDAVLVCARGRAQDVKKIVDRLKTDGRPETEIAPRSDTAAGTTRLLSRAGGGVTELRLSPGAGRDAPEGARYLLLEGEAVLDRETRAPLSPGRVIEAAGPHRLVSGGGAVLLVLPVL